MRELIGIFGFVPVAGVLCLVAFLFLTGARGGETVAEEATSATETAGGCGIVMVCSVLAILAILAIGAASVATLPHP